MQHHIIKFAILALSFGAACGLAQETDKPKASRNITQGEARNNNPEGEGLAKSAPSGLGKADRVFITKGAENSLFVIAASRLVVNKGASPGTKEFARTAIVEHSQILESLKRVAVNHNYPLPEELTESSRDIVAQMDNLSGKAIDRAYVQQVASKAYADDIKLLKRARRATRDRDLTGWISETLPKLERRSIQSARLLAG